MMFANKADSRSSDSGQSNDTGRYRNNKSCHRTSSFLTFYHACDLFDVFIVKTLCF